MECCLAVAGWVWVPALVAAQDTTPRDRHEMHQLPQDPKAYIAMIDFFLVFNSE